MQVMSLGAYKLSQEVKHVKKCMLSCIEQQSIIIRYSTFSIIIFIVVVILSLEGLSRDDALWKYI